MLRAEVAARLLGTEPLPAVLNACMQGLVDRLDLAFARLWILQPDAPVLELVASAGLFTSLEGPTKYIPVGKLMVGYIAEVGHPVLTNAAQQEPRLAEVRECLEEYGLTAFAGYPLVAEGKLVGVVAGFATAAFEPEAIDAFASVADAVAQGLAREQARNALDALTRSLESQVQARTAELIAADRYKDEFLSVVSHELRTPLNFIVGFASILADGVQGELPPAQRGSIDKILFGADRMLVLIDDLLDLAKIRAGRLDLITGEQDAAALVLESAALLRPLADRKGLVLAATAEAGEPVLMDRLRIAQVLQNLLANAIKFSQRGTITLHAAREGGRWVVRVRDEGVGIAEADLARLFTPFRQLDISATRLAGGSGLGLAICKQLVEAHEGSIGVESTPGEGSTFWFALPA
ncbi:MAG: multi-sensor hybrid histidine kinase [Cyanobacteria bacterium RYN_339]|nr:multi-sensor hybrid histidine kinase [Cyanobacteria bacterium RYN_339]